MHPATIDSLFDAWFHQHEQPDCPHLHWTQLSAWFDRCDNCGWLKLELDRK